VSVYLYIAARRRRRTAQRRHGWRGARRAPRRQQRLHLDSLASHEVRHTQDDGTPGFTPYASAPRREAAGIVGGSTIAGFFSIELLDATRNARIAVADPRCG
jgi:hypothetical protein